MQLPSFSDAPVPPQNLVDRAIVDVSTLGVKLACPPMLHLLYALLATARSSLKSQRELALENLALLHPQTLTTPLFATATPR
jgi:hypothetical protein